MKNTESAQLCQFAMEIADFDTLSWALGTNGLKKVTVVTFVS